MNSGGDALETLQPAGEQSPEQQEQANQQAASIEASLLQRAHAQFASKVKKTSAPHKTVAALKTSSTLQRLAIGTHKVFCIWRFFFVSRTITLQSMFGETTWLTFSIK